MFFWSGHDKGPIGLIAGNGEFPVLFAQAAAAAGKEVFAFGVKGHTDSRLEGLVRKIDLMEWGQVEKLVDCLKKYRIKKIVLAGGVPKREIYNASFQMDPTAQKLVFGAKNRGDDHLLRGFQLFLKARCGVETVDARRILKNITAKKGLMTQRPPSKEEWEDLWFGYKMAKAVGRLDIGQTLVVKKRVVLAVEAIEGTDAAIRRGALLGNGEVVVVKVSKPRQDLKFDLPCVGLDTIESLKSGNARVLGIEANNTIMLSREQLIESADAHQISIVGL